MNAAAADSAVEAGAPAVEFEGVGFTYPGAAAPALENISLRVERGERLGILGPNGGGKSTLLKLMLGLLRPGTGSVRVCGVPAVEARRAGIVGYVPQKPEAELAMPLSVREMVVLGAAWRASPFGGVAKATRERVERMLRLTGADAFAEQPVGGLSGGQVQRAMIARALASEARVLSLDEPMVGIDASGQQRFAELLGRVHDQLGVTILVVTHDIRAVVAGSDRVACLARRLHSHTSPEGLTPAVLAELFSHDIAGLSGLGGALAGMHVHAHGAGEPCAGPTLHASGMDAKARAGEKERPRADR